MDSWPIASTSKLTEGKAAVAAPDTPTRASRTKGTTNHIPYNTFTRTSSDGTAIHFGVGDAVVVAGLAPLRQKWLQLPDSLYVTAKGRKGKGSEKVKNKKLNGWSHEDGFKGKERVAIILGFYEDEKEVMMVQLRWFARPGAVWGTQGPEDDEQVEAYELYYTADSSYAVSLDNKNKTPQCTDSIPISYILQPATILTADEFKKHAKRFEGCIPSFLVKKVYDAKPMAGAEFMGEIDWRQVYILGMKSGNWDTEPVMEEEDEHTIIVSRKRQDRSKRRQASEGSPSKKRKIEAGVESNVESDSDDDEADAGASYFATPPRSGASHTRRNPSSNQSRPAPTNRRSESVSPTKKQNKIQPKRTQNAINRAARQTKKRNQFKEKNQPGSCALPPAFTTSAAFEKLTVFERAKLLLHVSATPEFLPRREQERTKISSILGDAILSQSGTCLFIAGVPGTGKTATVHSVVRELQQDEDMDEFQFVEINGMKLPDPSAAFSVLWRALSGEKSGARQALASLEEHFQTPDPTRKTTVVLVDELDQMFTKKQEVIYNFFNWPHIAHSRLIVIAIANTINLPETLPGKIRSRLGSNSITFEAYTAKDLEAILEARMEGFHQKVFDPNTLSFLGRKVAGALGDARRALDVARRIVEKVDQQNREAQSLDKKAKKRLCSMHDINETYREMTEYGPTTFVKQASLQQKVLLLALSQCIKRAGIPEVPLGDVFQWHLDFLRRTDITPFPSQSELFTLVAGLHSLRLLGTESQREDYYQRVRSTIDNGTLFEVLKAEEKLSRHVPKI